LCNSDRFDTRPQLPESSSLWHFFKQKNQQFRGLTLRSGSGHPHTLLKSRPAYRQSSRFTGWRGGVLACVLLVAFCILAEIALLVVGLKLYNAKNGLGTMYHGSCERVKALSTYLLIPLNALGTVTIGSSNYVMQILNAPDRQEVDKAHAKGCFLNIGISSPGNLLHLSKRKRTLYGLLALSTVPFHLLLNSAIFASLQANNYGVMIASRDYLDDPSWDAHTKLGSETATGQFVYDLRDSIIHKKTKFKNITAEECIQTYGNNLQSTSSKVILVTKEASRQWANLPRSNYSFQDLTKPPSNSTYKRPDYDISFSFNQTDGNVVLNPGLDNNFTYDGKHIASGLFLQPNDSLWAVQSLRAVFNAFDFRYWTVAQDINYNFNDSRTLLGNQWEPASWICSGGYILAGETCSAAIALRNASNWEVTLMNFPIDHCISSTTEESCTLQYSLHILIIILICEVFKLAAILSTLHLALTKLQPDCEPLTTIGDATASFLTAPEATTEAKCLVSQKHARVNMGGSLVRENLRLRGLYPRHEGFLENMTLQQKKIELPRTFGPEPLPWKDIRSSWGDAASRSQWVFLGSL